MPINTYLERYILLNKICVMYYIGTNTYYNYILILYYVNLSMYISHYYDHNYSVPKN